MATTTDAAQWVRACWPRRPMRPQRAPNTAGLIVLLVVICAAYFVPRGISWNPDTHIFLTASIVDRGTLNIDPLAAYTGDVAFARGHYYADKAPGLSLAAIPVYVVLKYTLLGGHPYASLFTVPAAERGDFLVRYLLAVVYAAVPTGIIAALLFSFLARFGLRTRWRFAVALAYVFGTFVRPFAAEFFSHQLAALLVFGAFIVLYRLRHGEMGERAAVAAGLMLGYAIITEYPVALIAAALAIYTLTSGHSGRRHVALLAAGALPPLVIGAVYNTLAFGGPLSQGYAHLAGPETFRVGQAQGLMGITYPHLDALWQITLGPYRGMFLLSPLLILAIPGFVVVWRVRAWRAETALWLAIVGAYFVFSISYFQWDGGFSMGPRQFLPALPFVMLPLAALLRPGMDARWRPVGVVLGIYSVVVIGLATAVGGLFDPKYGAPLTEWVLPRLAGFALTTPAAPPTGAAALRALAAHAPLFLTAKLDNNWGMVFGLPGLTQLVPLGLVVGGVIFWHWRRWERYSRVAGERQVSAAQVETGGEAWALKTEARFGGPLDS